VEKLRSTATDRLAAKEMWIAHFYANKGSWGAAGKRAEHLVREYPETRHAPRGLFLLGTSFHRVGEVEQAKQIRAVLVERFPESRFITRLDRALARAPGTPAEEEVFPRPYRALGATGMGGPPQ
jgi:outer membrane protein assembly factor BamD (BamD/ComL family)